MKKLLYILLFVPFSLFGQESNLYHIPDPDFLSWLQENHPTVITNDSLNIDLAENYYNITYIDNTSISSDQIYVKTFSGGRFMAPLKNSLFLPDNCHSKNPAVNPDGLYYATALCLGENNDFQLRYFPLFK